MEYKILRLTLPMPFGDTKNIVYPTVLWDKQKILLLSWRNFCTVSGKT